MAQLARSRPDPAPDTATREPVFAVIDEAEREAAIASILGEMTEDPDTAFRTDAVLYQDFLVRCRIRRLQGDRPACRNSGAGSPSSRQAWLRDIAAGAPWQQALALSTDLPDDVQSVFLMVAQGGGRRRAVPVGFSACPRHMARIRRGARAGC